MCKSHDGEVEKHFKRIPRPLLDNRGEGLGA